MQKHFMAIAGALIGVTLGIVFTNSSIIGILIGFAVGLLLGYVAAGMITAEGSALAQKFRDLGDIKGMTIEEIVSAVGDYDKAAECTITNRNNEKGMKYVWAKRGYIIVLLFGADGKCICILSEQAA